MSERKTGKGRKAISRAAQPPERMGRAMNLNEIVLQLESCDYECEAGALKNNIAFIELKRMSESAALAEHGKQGEMNYEKENKTK